MFNAAVEELEVLKISYKAHLAISVQLSKAVLATSSIGESMCDVIITNSNNTII